MYSIRLADFSLFPQMTLLWQECFGDSEEYIRHFLESQKDCFPIVWEEKGKILSMLFLLEMEFREKKGFYIYALCTKVEHRGKGIAGKLIEFSKSFAKDKDAVFLALIPGEATLFEYYRKMGFTDNIAQNVYFLTREELEKSEFRKKQNALILEFSELNYNYAVEENNFYGGIYLSNDYAKIFVKPDDSSCRIYHCDFSDFTEFKKLLLEKTDKENFEIALPCSYTLNEGKKITLNNGMILPLISGTFPQKIYFGLSLN